jgi:hypothetical protein
MVKFLFLFLIVSGLQAQEVYSPETNKEYSNIIQQFERQGFYKLEEVAFATEESGDYIDFKVVQCNDDFVLSIKFINGQKIVAYYLRKNGDINKIPHQISYYKDNRG